MMQMDTWAAQDADLITDLWQPPRAAFPQARATSWRPNYSPWNAWQTPEFSSTYHVIDMGPDFTRFQKIGGPGRSFNVFRMGPMLRIAPTP